MTNHSVVNEDVVSGRLLEKDVRNSGTKNEHPVDGEDRAVREN
jgi:hypothetical protein